LLIGTDKAKLNLWTGTFSVNIDNLSNTVNADQFTTGLSTSAVNYGAFTGTTIPDNQTSKAAFQALETAVEANRGDTVLYNSKTFTAAQLAYKQSNLQIQDEGVNQGTAGQATSVNFVGAGISTTVVGSTATVTISGGSSVIAPYSAGSGAIVRASAAGVTFTRTTASQWTINVPSGVDLYGFDINSTAAESATAALDVDIVFAGSRPYNQNTSLTDAYIPVLTTLRKGSPANYPTVAGTNNASFTATIPTAGTLRISTVEFAEVSSSGTVGTTVKGVW
jgi:uncharacterized protein YceK